MTWVATWRARRAARRALDLDRPASAPGGLPDTDELRAFIAKRLSPERAREIYAHLSRDPELFALWERLDEEADAAQARTSATPPAPQRPSPSRPAYGWRRALGTGGLVPALATVAAVGVALATFLGDGPPMSPTDRLLDTAPLTDHWPDDLIASSSGSLDTDHPSLPDRLAFLVGVRGALNELDLPLSGPDGRPLPARMPDCAAADADCEERRSALREIGRLSAITRQECIDGLDPTPERTARLDVHRTHLAQHGQLRWVVSRLDDWTKVEDATGCEQADRLEDWGLVALDALG